MPKIDAQIDKEEKQKKDGNEEAEEEEEEEDYMSMIIQEPHKPKDKETSIQRRARKEREVHVPRFSPLPATFHKISVETESLIGLKFK